MRTTRCWNNLHQTRSKSHTFTDSCNFTPFPMIVNNNYIVISIKPNCTCIFLLVKINKTIFVSDTEGQNYTLTNFTEMFNVLPKGLNYNIKTDMFYSDFVTGITNRYQIVSTIRHRYIYTTSLPFLSFIVISIYRYYKLTIPKFLLCLL